MKHFAKANKPTTCNSADKCLHRSYRSFHCSCMCLQVLVLYVKLHANSTNIKLYTQVYTSCEASLQNSNESRTRFQQVCFLPSIRKYFQRVCIFCASKPRTTYFKYCEAVHHDVLIACVGEEEEAVAPRSVLLSEIIQQLFCSKKEVGMRCKTKLSAETKMNVTIQETVAASLKLKCHRQHGRAGGNVS